jgi:hypothetical protein
VRRAPEPRRHARAPRPRRLHGRQPGDGTRRVRGTRRIAGPVSDGQRRAVSGGAVRRRGRFHPPLRPGQPALAGESARHRPATGARVSAQHGGHRALLPALHGGARRCTGSCRPGARRPASSSTCRCFSTPPPHCSTTCRPAR